MMVFRQGGHSPRWSLANVVSRLGDLLPGGSTLSLVKVVFRQGGLSSRWSFVKVVFHQALDSVVATNIRFSHPPRHSGRECHWVYENPVQLKAESEHFLKAYIPATRHCSQCGNATLHQQ